MPNPKRERQRAARLAKREAAEAARRRAQRRRQIITIVVAFLAIVAIGFWISRGGDDASTVATGDKKTSSKAVDPFAPPAYQAGDAECPPAAGAPERTVEFTAPPKKCITDGVDYQAVITTDVGEVTVDLFEDKAPRTVNSFVFLARYKAYEGIPFHRVIPGFVVQGGDVQNQQGTGGPGYDYADELPEQGEYEIGSLAMANSGPDTNGSQFFIITGDQGVQLPPSYNLFGKVTGGLDVVKKIEADGSEGGTPTVEHTITSVRIIEKK